MYRARIQGQTVALVIRVQLRLGFLPGVVHGLIFAYIWIRGESLVVSRVYHAVYDGLRDSLAITIGIGPLTNTRIFLERVGPGQVLEEARLCRWDNSSVE